MTVCVTDLDGTLTCPVKDARAFMGPCQEQLAAVTGLASADVRRIAEQVEDDMRQNGRAYDWNFASYATCSTIGDPYLRIIYIAEAVFRNSKHAMSAAEQESCLASLLTNHYPTEGTFRDGVGEFIARLQPACHVVTNSKTTKVVDKLRALATGTPAHRVALETAATMVQGSARKQVIDSSFTRLPESLNLPGFHRPVLLRRAAYFTVLEGILKESGADWQDLVVFGDHFELDLVVPWFMGARIVLMANDMTPPWEVAFVRNSARSFVASSLYDAGNAIAI